MSRWLHTLLAVSALAVAAPACAGDLYRCVDKKGVTAYSSSRAGYTNCKLVGKFQDSKPAAKPAAAAAPPPAAVEFRSAPGEAQPKPVAVPLDIPKPKITQGAVYKYTRNGVTHYTNRRPAGKAQVLFTYIETCFACTARPAVDFNSVGLNLTAYADEVANAAVVHGVDEALVRAVMHAESAFDSNALSRAGAQGLMQLIPATAARFGVENAFDPGQNINGGVSYLAWLAKRFDGDLRLVAAGYNAGEGAVDRYDGVPPYQETMLYVDRVGILHQRYREALATAKAPATSSAAAASGGAGG